MRGQPLEVSSATLVDGLVAAAEGRLGVTFVDPDERERFVGWAEALDRARVRAHFEVRFTAARQAEDYEQLYRLLIERRPAGEGGSDPDNGESQAVAPLLHAA